MLNIRGRLVDSKGNKGDKYIGHQVLASFTRQVSLDGTDGIEAIWRPFEQSAKASAEGAFTLALPDREQLRDPITFQVLAPNGEVLAIKEFLIKDLPSSRVPNLSDDITIRVDAKVFFPITANPDPFLGKRAKITGRVLDIAGKRLIADRQVILFARPKAVPANEFTAVLVAQTDRQGYFSGDYPRDAFEQAYAVVPEAQDVGGEDRIPIRLEDGAFPKNVILVVAIGGDQGSEGDCECHFEVPRTPDSEDLTRSSASYSTDLGRGRCVDLTTPNRTLEEFESIR